MRSARIRRLPGSLLPLFFAALSLGAGATGRAPGAAPSNPGLRDSLTAWRTTARTLQQAGRRDSARVVYEKCLRISREQRIPVEEGWALLGLGSLHQEQGRWADAEARALAARERFRAADDWPGLTASQYALASALGGQKRTEEARREYHRLIDEAKRRRDREVQAQATGSFGVFEHTSGDISRAEGLYRSSLEQWRVVGSIDPALRVTNSLAVLYTNQGRYQEADSTLMLAMPAVEASRNFDIKARVLCQLGVVRREQHRFAEAAELGRRSLSNSDSLQSLTVVQVTYPLAGTYEYMGRSDLALALFDEQLRRHGSRFTPTQRRGFELARAYQLRLLGRPREALTALRLSAAEWDAPRGALDGAQKLKDLMELARCYRDVGELDSARIWYERITERWEAWRASTTDPGWREKYDDYARNFTGGYAAVLLDPRRPGTPARRAREAFDMLQRFRARTLLERIQDPSAGADTVLRITPAAELQQRVLRPGEVFLDVHALAETSIVVALSRDTIRAYCLAASMGLTVRLQRWRELLAAPEAPAGGLVSSTSVALGTELLDPVDELLARSRRVVIAAGSYARFPLDQLVLPGEKGPLMLAREVTWVPSASLLAAARSTRDSRADRALLAIAQSKPLDGVALPAAKREAQWLSHQFAMTDVLVDGGIANASTVMTRAPGYEVLHLAAHTRSGGRRPWQDAIRLGTSSKDDAWLTAGEIARLRLTTRLCVMAGCTTVGGGMAVSETLEGLSTAWLAAGARTVLATQWDVDDQATSELMKGFYLRLARGTPAGAALREAQLEMRAVPRYAHPYYWAGVQLIGEPETRVALKPRQAGKL